MAIELLGNPASTSGHKLEVTVYGFPQSDKAKTGAKSTDPQDRIDLSDEAKLRLERIEKLEAERAAANKLIKALEALKEGEESNFSTTSPLSEITSEEDTTVSDFLNSINQIAENGFGDLDKVLETSRNHETTTGRATLESLVTASLAIETRALEFAGKNEHAQQLRDAAVGGNLRFEDATKVEDLNVTYDKIITKGPGRESARYDLNQNPVGDVKEAIDSGRAFTLGQGGFGAFYVTTDN